MNEFEKSYSIYSRFNDQLHVTCPNPMMPNTTKCYFYNQHKYLSYPFSPTE